MAGEDRQLAALLARAPTVGYDPSMHARAQSQLQSVLSMPSPDPWTALAKGLSAYMSGRRIDKADEARAAQSQATSQALQAFLTGGGDARSLAAALSTPGIDRESFLRDARGAQSLMPEPEPERETFSRVDDPYGRGGVGQQSSTTGKISGWQGPVKPDRAPGIVGEYMAARAAGIIDKTVRFEDFADLKRAQTNVTTNVGGVGFKESQQRPAQAARTAEASLAVLKAQGENGQPIFNQGTNLFDSANPTSYFKDPDRQRYEQALKSIVQDILYMKTGAQATADESETMTQRFGPRPGDTQEVIAQKMAGLELEYETAKKMAGPGYEEAFGEGAQPPPQPAPVAPPGAPPGAPPMAASMGAGAPPDPAQVQARVAEIAANPDNFTLEELKEASSLWEAIQGAGGAALDFVVPPAGAASVPTVTPAPGFAMAPPVQMTPTAAPTQAHSVPGGGVPGPMVQTPNQINHGIEVPGAGAPLEMPATPLPLLREPGLPRDFSGHGIEVPGAGAPLEMPGPAPPQLAQAMPATPPTEQDRVAVRKMLEQVQGMLPRVPIPGRVREEVTALLGQGDVAGALAKLEATAMPDRRETAAVMDRLGILADIMGQRG